MSDAIHLQVYRRFFAVLFSVIPGLNLIVGSAALMLWLFADVIEVDWGVGIGIAAVTFALVMFAWIFIGLAVQKWAEQKNTGMLAGMCAPFLVVDAIVMGWLFYDVVIAEREEEAMRVVEVLSMLG